MPLFRLLIMLILTCTHISSFANLIRDSEIEEAIELIISPLKKASGITDLKVHIIDDISPNAFTIGGNEVFINSGLIIDYPDPDILRGVVAHEIGHLLGQHVIRRQEVIDNYRKASLGTIALGLAAAMSGAAPEGMAIAMGGSHFAERSILAHSRVYESSADQTALKLLEKSGHSSIGLISFFEKIKMFNNSSMINPYEQTHPISNDRLDILRNSNQQSKFKNSQNTNEVIYKYSRSAAKLAAFTLDLDKVLSYINQEDNNELIHYMKAIRYFRMGDFDNSLNHINHLLVHHTSDPYYHELKAQIYFEAGKSAALAEYIMAEKSRPNDVLIRLGKAVVGITMGGSNPDKLIKFYDDLVFVIKNDPDNLLALYYLAIYYDRLGEKGKSYLNTSLISLKYGRIDEARTMAKAAMNNLPKKSPHWYKAGDILAATE